MDFGEFLRWSQTSRVEVPNASCFCETRISVAYSAIRPMPELAANAPDVHRCDLARLWCETYGVDPSLSPTALVCEGVRQALEIIFESLARRGAGVAVPTDVYPVYWRLASQARLRPVGFATFPQFEVAEVLRTAAQASALVVLLPQPLKLHGRSWTELEVAAARDWLRDDPARRIILDGVYGFGAPLDSGTNRLLATDQVLLLDSLSKGWLHERVFGVALVPRRDLATYSATFRSLAPAKPKLALAHELLTKYRQFPQRLLRDMSTRRRELMARARDTRISTLPAAGGYFVAMQCSAQALLVEHSLLTIPVTVFGSGFADWSIASVLPAPDAAS